jgi:hypothetical protein
MRTVRKILSAVALLGLLAATVAAGVTVWTARLSDPAEADERDLARWLVTRDLAAEPSAVRAKLLRRLERELRRGPNLAGLSGQLTPAQRQALWGNIETLAWDWLREQAAAYSRLPAGQGGAFLDRQLAFVEAWPVREAAPPSKGAPASAAGLRELLETLEKRIDRTPRPERDQVRQFVLAVQARILLRTLQGASGLRVPQG